MIIPAGPLDAVVRFFERLKARDAEFGEAEDSSPRVMARWGGCSLIAGGAMVAIVPFLLPETFHRSDLVLEVVVVVAVLAGLVVYRQGQRSVLVVHAATLVGTGLVTLLIFAQQANMYGLFYFWAIVYAVYFFRPVAASFQIAVVASCHAVAVALVPTGGFPRGGWVVITVVLAAPAAAIVLLRGSLRRAGARQSAIIATMPNGLVVADASGRIRLVNEALSEMFGYTAEELIGEHVELLMPGRFQSRHRDLRAGFMGEGSSRSMASGAGIVGGHRDGSEFPVTISLSPTRIGSETFVIAVIRDDTERAQLLASERAARGDLEALRDKLATLAATDSLTGLLNRREIDSVTTDLIALARETGHALSCLLVDLDFFKRINDSMGHLAGDEVLRGVAARLLAMMRDTDVVGRFGGDEFLIILPDTNAKQAAGFATRVLETLAAPLVVALGRPPLQIRASVGVGEFRPSMRDKTDLYRAADTALYSAKYLGRDRVEAA